MSQTKLPKIFLLTLWLSALCPSLAEAQSGAAGGRLSGYKYGINLTFAAYQFDAPRSATLEPITRLSGTYSSAEEEIAHITEKYKLEQVAVRHIRSVGLRNAEAFNDAVLLGPHYMAFYVTPHQITREAVKLDFVVRYGNQTLLDLKDVEVARFETVLLKGASGMFGAKFFIGPGGRQESAPMERTLLLSVTPEIVPLASLRNRPEQLAQPVDEYGSPLRLRESDKFTPPVPIDRVAPKFETGRPIQGTVRLAGLVTPDGKIINVRVVRGLDPAIDARAVEAFRQYRFSPALLNDKPVHSTYSEDLFFAPPTPSALELMNEIERQRKKEKEKKP